MYIRTDILWHSYQYVLYETPQVLRKRILEY